MTQVVSVERAQERLQDLLAQALAGNEVIITDHGKRLRVWFPFQSLRQTKKRVSGLNRGTIWTSGDFDQPLPDEFWLGQE